MKICVDTVILIDVLKDENKPYHELLYSAMKTKEEIVIPVVVYAELMPQFKGDEGQVDLFLKAHRIKVENLDLKSVQTAAIAWMVYLKRKSKVICPKCGERLGVKEHFLSDFYIGGFAITRCDAILTRDRGIYRRYFSELKGYMNCLSLGEKVRKKR